MNFIDLLLNLAGVLLWLGWRAVGMVRSAPAATISSVLKRAEIRRPRRWLFLVWLVALLALRGLLYWRIGSSVNWVPGLDLGVVRPEFNSVSPQRMLVFSFASFGLTLAVFYMWLSFIAVLNRSGLEADVWQKLVRLHLGILQRLPSVLKLATPMVLAAALWMVASPLMVRAGMAPKPVSAAQLWEQAAVVGLGTTLAWKYLMVLILFLGILNTYLYLGNSSFWTFVGTTSRNLLQPLQRLPLRAGRVDCAPVVGLALCWLGFTAVEKFLNFLFARLPL